MKRILLILVLAVYAQLTYSQNLAEIKVNENYSATLKFPDNIKYIIFGNNPQISQDKVTGMPVFKYYDPFKTKNTAIIRAKNKQAPSTSLTVILENDVVFTGSISYNEKSKKVLYDYTKIKKQKDVAKADSTNKINEAVDNRLKNVMQRTRYENLGAIASGVKFQVANIQNDNLYTYFYLIINNETASDYLIDGIIFKYDDNMKKGLRLKKDEQEKIKRLHPVTNNIPGKVDAYSFEKIGYVIEKFTTTDRGELLINILEKDGNRTAKITIDAKELAKINVFDTDL